MNKIRFLLIIALFCTTVPFCFARGNKEAAQTATITGTVRLVGTAIFPEIVITTQDGEWYIAANEISKLNNYQHRTVTVRGEETVIQLSYSNGAPAGTRRELKNVQVIRVE